MLKKIWLLAILTLPLVGSEFFRLSGIPITTLFLLFLLLLEFPKPFLSIRKNKYFKYLLIYVLVNIVVSVFDLNRSYDVLLLENFIIKQIVLLLFSISLLFNIDKYGFDYFLKYFNIASITLITALFVRSYFILGSPYFVVTTMDEINENSTTFFLLNDNATAKKVNMVTALTTDAESTAIKANIQSNKTMIMVFKNNPYLILSRGLKIKDKIHRITPTCNPETAKIWIAPALW